MSCGTCGIQASNTMQADTGVPAGAPQTQRPRCPHCKAFVAQTSAACNNPRCPGQSGGSPAPASAAPPAAGKRLSVPPTVAGAAERSWRDAAQPLTGTVPTPASAAPPAAGKRRVSSRRQPSPPPEVPLEGSTLTVAETAQIDTYPYKRWAIRFTDGSIMVAQQSPGFVLATWPQNEWARARVEGQLQQARQEKRGGAFGALPEHIQETVRRKALDEAPAAAAGADLAPAAAASSVTHSAGIYTGSGGTFAGAGYGRNKTVSQAADDCGALLAEAFGQEVEVRCNSSGESGGAYRNGVGGMTSWYGLGVRRQAGQMKYHASFAFPVAQTEQVQAEVPHHDVPSPSEYDPRGCRDVESPPFDSAQEAMAWLTHWGGQFCPKLQGHRPRATG